MRNQFGNVVAAIKAFFSAIPGGSTLYTKYFQPLFETPQIPPVPFFFPTSSNSFNCTEFDLILRFALPLISIR